MNETAGAQRVHLGPYLLSLFLGGKIALLQVWPDISGRLGHLRRMPAREV